MAIHTTKWRKSAIKCQKIYTKCNKVPLIRHKSAKNVQITARAAKKSQKVKNKIQILGRSPRPSKNFFKLNLNFFKETLTIRVVYGIIYHIWERVMKMEGILTPMKWIRYTKEKEKEINFLEFEWHTKREAIIAKVVKDGRTYGLALMDKNPFNTLQIYSVSETRIPLVVSRAQDYHNMAMNTIIFNNRVTRNNARNEVYNAMKKDEILVDWSKGFAYFRVGRSTMKRFKIEEFWSVDKKKLINWHERTRENDLDDEQD